MGGRHTLHEAAHKAASSSSRAAEQGAGGGDHAPAGPDRDGELRTATARHPLNEAAHKLQRPGELPPTLRGALRMRQAAASARRFDAEGRDVTPHSGRTVLALGALGVVFGDLGTSPLYSEQVSFTAHANVVHPTPTDAYGIVSLIFWALTIIVSLKYAGVIMRAHNHGDGGIMALTALIERNRLAGAAMLATLGIIGASLFLGDGMITPAISVLSAVEGLKVATPGLAHLVLPIAALILALLFLMQRFGTGQIGWLFGPVMLLWFGSIGALGLIEVIPHPQVLQALSPTWAVRFLAAHGLNAFLVLGSVVLAVTGAEALYADRGHFGPTPIRIAWFCIVLPGVLLSYLGQAALIIARPRSISNPFYLLVPSDLRIAMVVLAAMATVIASQAVISGSFSVARQAVQLGLLPRLRIVHTSRMEGQIYVPSINWTLGIGVLVLVLVFQTSSRLANMYGMAVTGTFICDTLLFLTVLRGLWHIATWKLVTLGSTLLIVEVTFFASNLAKLLHGAWLPLSVGLVLAVVMLTWRRGREILSRNRSELEGELGEFLAGVAARRPPATRIPGTAIFLSPSRETTPLAMRALFEHDQAIHQRVLIVSAEPVSVPYVDPGDRCVVELIGTGTCRAVHVTARFGYRERQDVPAALALARKRGLLDRALDLEHASYVVSRMFIRPVSGSGMARWRKRLFMVIARNTTSPIEYFSLPYDRALVIGAHVPL
jgi:KUP system potassium uptake protein